MKNKIAIVFDFDITLSPYYQQKELIKYWGIDEDIFWQKCTNKVEKEFYDMELGYIKVILEQIQKDKKYYVSNQDLYELGKKITLYKGLTKKNNEQSIFDDIEKLIKDKKYQKANIEVEYYCISGGIVPMIKGAFDANNISCFFKKIFACRFDEDKNGCINFPKEIVGHTIKTQKLFQIAKGLDKHVNQPVQDYKIPFTNFIFIGDGETDIPAFSLINKMGGISIAVYRESKNKDGKLNEKSTLHTYNKSFNLVIKDKRAKQLLPADYSNGKPLKLAIIKYVKDMCEKILEK